MRRLVEARVFTGHYRASFHALGSDFIRRRGLAFCTNSFNKFDKIISASPNISERSATLEHFCAFSIQLIASKMASNGSSVEDMYFPVPP